MRSFKLLSGYDEEEIENYNGASWVYARHEYYDVRHYLLRVEHHYGIHSFLNQFPNHFIVPILSITGPDGVVHDCNNEGIGWGFDITSDQIKIEWLMYRN